MTLQEKVIRFQKKSFSIKNSIFGKLKIDTFSNEKFHIYLFLPNKNCKNIFLLLLVNIIQ